MVNFGENSSRSDQDSITSHLIISLLSLLHICHLLNMWHKYWTVTTFLSSSQTEFSNRWGEATSINTFWAFIHNFQSTFIFLDFSNSSCILINISHTNWCFFLTKWCYYIIKFIRSTNLKCLSFGSKKIVKIKIVRVMNLTNEVRQFMCLFAHTFNFTINKFLLNSFFSIWLLWLIILKPFQPPSFDSFYSSKGLFFKK